MKVTEITITVLLSFEVPSFSGDYDLDILDREFIKTTLLQVQI